MLELRPFQLTDTAALCHILNDSQVVKYLSTKIPYPYTEEDAIWWVQEGSQQGLIRAICWDDEMVGCIGVVPGEFEYSRSGEIGYWLAPSHWRKGIMSKAIAMISEQVFKETEIVRLFAAVFEGNRGSQQLLLKSGFEPEATMKQAIYKQGCFYDCHTYYKLKPTG